MLATRPHCCKLTCSDTKDKMSKHHSRLFTFQFVKSKIAIKTFTTFYIFKHKQYSALLSFQGINIFSISKQTIWHFAQYSRVQHLSRFQYFHDCNKNTSTNFFFFNEKVIPVLSHTVYT